MSDHSDQLFLRCTNCRALFPAAFSTTRKALDSVVVEDKVYKCPVCANFDTYAKADLFFDD